MKPSGYTNPMKVKNFKKFLRGKSVDKLLHKARKSSLQRILANEVELVAPIKKSHPSKRAAGA